METRQLFVGDATLATGFRLAGFEVFPDGDITTLEKLLEELQTSRTPAFVVIDERLGASDSRPLNEVRQEGGRILLTQVPMLGNAAHMHSAIDDRIRQLLGSDGESS